MVHLDSTWSPGEIQVDYACQFGCAPSQKKSTWTPGGLRKITWTPEESTWNMWGKVKSSTGQWGPCSQLQSGAPPQEKAMVWGNGELRTATCCRHLWLFPLLLIGNHCRNCVDTATCMCDTTLLAHVSSTDWVSNPVACAFATLDEALTDDVIVEGQEVRADTVSGLTPGIKV